MLIYLHGFNSSSQSFKARLLVKYARSIGVAERLFVPDIPPLPTDAIAFLDQYISQKKRQAARLASAQICLIGSSLGGYYATWLAEKYHCRAVLINPAVHPYELLKDYVGKNKNIYTGEEYELDYEQLEPLHQLEVKQISHPDRYLLMLQTGDELLDYKLAMDRYAGVPSIVEEGGAHEFMGFDRHLDTVLAFCGINCLKRYC